MSATEHVRVGSGNGLTTIELARPEKKNALTIAMYRALAEAFERAGADPAIRAILLAGQPGIFCAGNDLEDFLARPLGAREGPLSPFMVAMLTCPKPVVAAVTGPAVGIGVTMLLHCDLVYLSDQARLTLPFVALGLVPEFGSSLLIPRLLGPARAAEKLLLGEPITPSEAVACGLATAVLPADQVVAHARRAAERFNSLPPDAVRETKRLLRAGYQDRLVKTAEIESRLLAQRLDSPEAREALRAFLEKRAPDFSEAARVGVRPT